jgi:hypothetical protein
MMEDGEKGKVGEGERSGVLRAMMARQVELRAAKLATGLLPREVRATGSVVPEGTRMNGVLLPTAEAMGYDLSSLRD